jgi:plasmid stabilization system protein ParE
MPPRAERASVQGLNPNLLVAYSQRSGRRQGSPRWLGRSDPAQQVVPYRERGETVQILRVFHTSRRLPDRW